MTKQSYEFYRNMFMNDQAVTGKAKQALTALDDMDCVKALRRARDIVYMLEIKCDEAAGIEA